MNDAVPSVLLVCTSCRASDSDPAAPRPGAALLAAVKAGLKTQTADCSTVQVQGVTCLSGCRRPCAVALLATDRMTYLFGDLPADETSAAELLRAAHDHATAPDGWLPRAARPARLRNSILARMPPLHWLPAAGDETLAWPA